MPDSVGVWDAAALKKSKDLDVLRSNAHEGKGIFVLARLFMYLWM